MSEESESVGGSTMAKTVKSVDRKITLLIALWLLDKAVMVGLFLAFG